MWFAIKDITDPKIGLALAGTESWGEVWALVYSKSGDVNCVDAEYQGFMLDEDTAKHVVDLLNREGIKPCPTALVEHVGESSAQTHR